MGTGITLLQFSCILPMHDHDSHLVLIPMFRVNYNIIRVYIYSYHDDIVTVMVLRFVHEVE